MLLLLPVFTYHGAHNSLNVAPTYITMHASEDNKRRSKKNERNERKWCKCVVPEDNCNCIRIYATRLFKLIYFSYYHLCSFTFFSQSQCNLLFSVSTKKRYKQTILIGGTYTLLTFNWLEIIVNDCNYLSINMCEKIIYFMMSDMEAGRKLRIIILWDVIHERLLSWKEIFYYFHLFMTQDVSLSMILNKSRDDLPYSLWIRWVNKS